MGKINVGNASLRRVSTRAAAQTADQPRSSFPIAERTRSSSSLLVISDECANNWHPRPTNRRLRYQGHQQLFASQGPGKAWRMPGLTGARCQELALSCCCFASIHTALNHLLPPGSPEPSSTGRSQFRDPGTLQRLQRRAASDAGRCSAGRLVTWSGVTAGLESGVPEQKRI